MWKVFVVGGILFDSFYVNIVGEFGYFVWLFYVYGKVGIFCDCCGILFIFVVIAGCFYIFCLYC